MPIDLLSLLPKWLPVATDWVEEQSALILAHGSALSVDELRLAEAVGVSAADRIRVSIVDSIPLPDDPSLRQLAVETGLLGPGIAGITFGYGIYVCRDALSPRLLSHECRHVYQYERAGSIGAFLADYLSQVATVGYADAPFEIDARRYEIPA